jgi:hypothetical protein
MNVLTSLARDCGLRCARATTEHLSILAHGYKYRPLRGPTYSELFHFFPFFPVVSQILKFYIFTDTSSKFERLPRCSLRLNRDRHGGSCQDHCPSTSTHHAAARGTPAVVKIPPDQISLAPPQPFQRSSSSFSLASRAPRDTEIGGGEEKASEEAIAHPHPIRRCSLARSPGHGVVAEADAAQGHRPRRQRVSVSTASGRRFILASRRSISFSVFWCSVGGVHAFSYHAYLA